MENKINEIKKEIRGNCQICERDIKGGKGILAHHGYKRPGNGWQSDSCMGARNLPYEVSKDMIPPVIEHVKNFIITQTKTFKDFIKNPPETLIYKREWNKPETYNRPEGFKYDENHRSYNYNQRYEVEFNHRVYQFEESIKWAKRDLKNLEKRLANWVQKYTVEEWNKIVREDHND